jgi:hypothetical protein
MYDRELNSISFEMSNLEENFYYGPETNYGKPIYKRFSNLEAIEEAFEEAFETTENFRKKGKGKGKGLFKKVGQGIKKATKKIGEKIKDVAKNLKPEDALFLPLIPFKALLRKRLDKRGIKYKSSSLKNLAIAFYNAEVKGKNFEDLEENLVDDTATIIKAIINFITKIKEKRAAGTATADEMELSDEADSAASVADEIDEADIESEFLTKDSRSEGPVVETGGREAGMGLSTNTIMILVVAVVALYFVSKKS